MKGGRLDCFCVSCARSMRNQSGNGLSLRLSVGSMRSFCVEPVIAQLLQAKPDVELVDYYLTLSNVILCIIVITICTRTQASQWHPQYVSSEGTCFDLLQKVNVMYLFSLSLVCLCIFLCIFGCFKCPRSLQLHFSLFKCGFLA